MITDEKLVETFANMQTAQVAMTTYLAARVIDAGLADREDMISDIEKIASAGGDPLGIFAKVADTLKKKRPWGVIEGGKDADQ